MRKRPTIEPPQTLTHRELDLIEQIREYKLITPLYGGGVTPGEADPVTVVRATEIRGHLRFWWRATRGGQFGHDPKAMKNKEDEIWGKAHTTEKKGATSEEQEKHESENTPFKQPVQIEVMLTHAGESKKSFSLERNTRGNLIPKGNGIPDYAAFPMRPPQEDLRRKTQKQLEEEIKSVRHHVQFTLKIIFSRTHSDDVQAALWAWETFGGIGARTRRGFGALRLLMVNSKKNDDLPPSNQRADVRRWINEHLEKFVVAGAWPSDVPHLEQKLFFELAYPATNTFYPWRQLIAQYTNFRQSRTKGRTGRSNWPEAEAIRELTGRRHYTSLDHPQKFPRAAFGLPILFHFKDEDDPKDTTLQGANKEHERLASPLILRPLACNGELAIGLAAILKGSRIPPLMLKEVDKSVEARLNKADVARLSQLDNDKLKGETDVLRAFLYDLGGDR
ncbi:MAG TPA: type III-B CRISPR module RAMP protein Cmr1 [Ktedonobacteraceae bacterium]|nr:type III-B CRISPR module RAMP protein Cmr1 [Ktedonobacteraceae bacterium]